MVTTWGASVRRVRRLLKTTVVSITVMVVARSEDELRVKIIDGPATICERQLLKLLIV